MYYIIFQVLSRYAETLTLAVISCQEEKPNKRRSLLKIQVGEKLFPIEIKPTATPVVKHVESLNKIKEISLGNAADTGLAVCCVKKAIKLPSNNLAIPWQNFPKWLFSKL